RPPLESRGVVHDDRVVARAGVHDDRFAAGVAANERLAVDLDGYLGPVGGRLPTDANGVVALGAVENQAVLAGAEVVEDRRGAGGRDQILHGIVARAGGDAQRLDVDETNPLGHAEPGEARGGDGAQLGHGGADVIDVHGRRACYVAVDGQ